MVLLLIVSACAKSTIDQDWKELKGELKAQIDKKEIKQREYFTLNFDGWSDKIVVYDGTIGHEYRHRNRTNMEGVRPSVSFTSFRRWGAQENSLAIKISTDFIGDQYDADEIERATWTDITDRFILSTGEDNTPSGTVDFSDLIEPGKDHYFAFQYKGQEGTTQREWVIKNFLIENELPIGIVQEVATTGTAGWRQYSFLNSQQIWTFNNTQMRIEGGNATSAENHDWLISKPLDFTKVSPDQPSHIIKTRFQNMIYNYKIGYAEPGQYAMVIVGENKEDEENKIFEYEVVVN